MTQNKITANFLGGFSLFYGETVLTIKSRKARAIFVYLAMGDKGIKRERLAELFWSEGALANLRQVIYQIRKLPQAEDFLVEDDGLLSINISSDLKLFEAALAQNKHQQALEIYKGKLLAGFNITNMTDFADWLEIERARLEQLFLKAMEERAQQLEENREYKQALELYDKILSIDVLNESCYCSAMRLSVYLGNRQAALKYYQTCVKALMENLGIESLPTTRELADAISRGEPLRPPSTIKNLDNKLFQVLAAIAISGDNSLALLEHLLAKNALEITADLSDLEKQGYLKNNRLLKPENEKEVLEVVEDS